MASYLHTVLAITGIAGKTVTFELNKKFEIRYNEQLASIEDFINRYIDINK
jgi:hypothetical protein